MLTKVIKVIDYDEIVSIEAFCEHSRITDLYDEIVVQQCLDAAHDSVQGWLNKKIYPTMIVGIEQDYMKEMYLPYPSVNKVHSVYAEDEDYSEIQLTEDEDWKFDTITGYLRFLEKPNSIYKSLNRYKITYECGYCKDTNPVPPAVIHAILMTAATLYENREDVVIGTQINKVPLDAQRLLRIHRARSQL